MSQPENDSDAFHFHFDDNRLSYLMEIYDGYGQQKSLTADKFDYLNKSSSI